MNRTNYIKLVAARALSGFEGIIQHLGLAAGKHQGREYLPLNPKRADSKPGSFSINQDTGAWADFATGDRGGDLVGLGAYLWGCHQSEAAERLGEFLGLPKPGLPESPARAGNTTRRTNTPAKPGKTNSAPPDAKPSGDGWACVMPVPVNAPKPPLTHSSHGKPSRRYAYTTGSGEVSFYHDRYEAKKKGDRKQFSPLSLWRSPAGKLEWKFKAPPAPRPLYGLPSLASFPDAPALLVEGEKAAEAAALLLPGYPLLTWQGGAQAVDKADFSPLAGRVVWIWPDNDEAGQKAADALVKSLRAARAKGVRLVNLDMLAQAPGMDGETPTLAPGNALEQGDDAVDLVARNWTAAHLARLLV